MMYTFLLPFVAIDLHALCQDGRGCEGYLEYVSDEKRDNLRLWFLGAQFVLITLVSI